MKTHIALVSAVVLSITAGAALLAQPGKEHPARKAEGPTDTDKPGDRHAKLTARAGKYSVDGSTIYLNPSRDFWRSSNSCAASGNKETTKAPTKKTLEFELKQDDYGQDMLCIQDGEANTCYGREKK